MRSHEPGNSCPQTVSDAQVAVLRDAAGDDQEALATLGVRDFAELPAVRFSEALRMLRA
jgi:hypothetical protein